MSSSYTTNLYLEKPAFGDALWDVAMRATLDMLDSLGVGLLAGLLLSTAGSSATFSVAPGAASGMVLSAALAKTTSAWAVGDTSGGLDVGSIANNTWYYPYLIKRVDTGVVDALVSLATGEHSTCTMTIATPGVVTWTDHGLQANAPVKFTTTGALPTGLVAGTQYFVKTVSSVDAFTVSATQGGTAINTTGSQSGVHTVSSTPVLPTNYTKYRRLGAMLVDGSAHWTAFTQVEDSFFWATGVADKNNYVPAGTWELVALTVPPGLNIRPIFGACYNVTDTTAHRMAFAHAVGGVATGNDAFFANQADTWPSGCYISQFYSNHNKQLSMYSSDTHLQVSLNTTGWIDSRGRNG